MYGCKEQGSSIAQPDQVSMHQGSCSNMSRLVLHQPLQLFSFIIFHNKFHISTQSVCTEGEAHICCIHKEGCPGTAQASGTLTGISGKAY